MMFTFKVCRHARIGNWVFGIVKMAVRHRRNVFCGGLTKLNILDCAHLNP
jgi:hypothetical protein